MNQRNEEREGVFYSTSLEKTVLGMCVMDNSLIPLVDSSLFYWQKSKDIMQTMIKLFKEEKPVDIVILTDIYKNSDLIDPLYVTSLLDGIPKTETNSFNSYLDKLGEYKKSRDLDVLSTRIQQALRSKDNEAVSNIASKIKERSLGLEKESHVLSANNLIDDLEEYRNSDGGIKIGIPSLDDASKGIAPGEIFYLLARAKVIKSIMTQNILKYFSGRYPEDGAVFFSLEMNSPQLGERLLRIESGKWLSDISKEEHSEIMKRHKNIFYITKAALSLRDIYSEIIRIKMRGNVKLVIIDFLTRIKTKINGEYEFLREATKFLKDMAKELGIALIVLAQVGREAGKDGDVPLSLRAGRGSGTIEEDADFILGAYRPELNNFLTQEERFLVEDIVCLQTLGARRLPNMRDIFLKFDKRSLRVREILPYISKKEFYGIVRKIKRMGRKKK